MRMAVSMALGFAEERALQRVLEAYVRVIEVKDVDLFRTVKPNLSPAEERRPGKVFESFQSQTIIMTILSVEVQGTQATVKAQLPQTLEEAGSPSAPR